MLYNTSVYLSRQLYHSICHTVAIYRTKSKKTNFFKKIDLEKKFENYKFVIKALLNLTTNQLEFENQNHSQEMNRTMAKVIIHKNKARVTISIADNLNLGCGLKIRAYFLGRLINTIIFFHSLLCLQIQIRQLAILKFYLSSTDFWLTL